jgi:hypothetical protein
MTRAKAGGRNSTVATEPASVGFGSRLVRDGKASLEQVVRIDVHEHRLAVRLKSANDKETSDAADDYSLSIPVAEAAIQEIQADSNSIRHPAK